MEFVKVGNGGKFHSAIYHRLLDSIVSYIAVATSFIYCFCSFCKELD